MIKEVLSRVEPNMEIFRDVCYEWEHELAKYLSVPIRQVCIVHNPLHDSFGASLPVRLIRKANQVIKRLYIFSANGSLKQNITKPLSVYFCMFVTEMNLCVGENALPIFLDVFSDKQFDTVINATRNLRIFYVTSRDVFNRIKAKAPSSNVRYLPQSVADKYHSENFAAYRDKFIDVFMPGRGNSVLHEYMLRYAAEHPSIKYAYRCKNPTTGNWECVSTDGSITLPLNTREEYIHVLSSAKVSLVGCSGIDNARPDANGICFVTPRFYESAVLGCALICRYPDNEEFTELNMRRYCPNITSYEHFCTELERALAQTPEQLYAQNRDFILNSLTSRRAEQIQRDLASLS